VTINKNLGKGRKVKNSKIAAKPVKVATNKVGNGKAISAKGSVGEVMGCIKPCQRPSSVVRSEFEVHRHGGNDYWRRILAYGCKDLNLKFREGSRDGRPCLFVGK
jgi:hypothetical protein